MKRERERGGDEKYNEIERKTEKRREKETMIGIKKQELK